MNEDLDILFDRYLSNELSEAERISCDERLANDMEFSKAFELHQLVIAGIQQHAQSDIRSELSTIYNNNKPQTDNQTYQPSIKGFNWVSFLIRTVIVLFLLSLLYVVVSIVTHKTIIKNKWIETYTLTKKLEKISLRI